MHRLARPVRTGLGTFPLVLGARLVLGLMGGVCLWLAFPGHDVWWLAVVGASALASYLLGVNELLVLLGFSGRGDKDLAALTRFDDVEPWASAR